MPSIFTSVKPNKPSYAKHNLSNINTLTMDFGQLIPIYTKRVYPGDHFRMNTNVFVEFMPMVFPVRAEIDVFIHHFFVPYRLIWNEFEDFITGGPDGTSAPTPPYFTINKVGTTTNLKHGSLYDYLNFPTFTSNPNTDNEMRVSSLKLRAYQLIFNEYYRDENLSEPIPINLNSGLDNYLQLQKLGSIRYRAWRKDYFTSALPFAQRGGAVQIATQDTLVKLKSKIGYLSIVDANGAPVREEDLHTNHDGQLVDIDDSPVYLDPGRTLGIDGGLFTVNDLRNYARVQQWLEMNARGGSRYIEQILMHFGVIGDDARLQRPEYLGGGKLPVMVQTIKQTSATVGNSYLGDHGGNAIAVGGDNFFSKYFKEHGLIMSIASVLPRSQYFQGIEREDIFTNKFDWYYPTFAHLGEQEIYNAELYYDPNENADVNLSAFGYAPRYSELRYKPNEVHGQMRGSLLNYHLARVFANRPNLNEGFIRMNPDQASRIFAVTDTSAESNHLICTFNNTVSAVRPVPRMATPKII